MKKLLIISPYYFEQHRWTASTVKQAETLSRTFKVTVLAAGPPGIERINPHLTVHLIRDFFIPDPINYGVMPGLFYHLLKIVYTEKPDYYLVNKFMFFSALAIFCLRLLGKKVYVSTDTFPGINWFPRSRVVRYLMKLYAYLIGLPCLYLAEEVVLFHPGLIEVASGFNLKYRVIPNGVDYEKFANAPEAPDLKKGPDEIFITYVGRLESIKGYDDLLDVAGRLLARFSHIRFLFVGDLGGKKDLTLKFNHPRISFLGFRADVPSVMKSSDIFVLPSYAEGLPNAMMEAMAAGLACLATKVGGVNYLVEEGETGLTFTPGDKVEMENKLIALLGDADLRRSLGAKAARFIKDYYSLDAMQRKYLEIFPP